MKLQWQLNQSWPVILDQLDCHQWASSLQSVTQMPGEPLPVLTAAGQHMLKQPVLTVLTSLLLQSDLLSAWSHLSLTWTCLANPALLSSETEGKLRLFMVLMVVSQCLRSSPHFTAYLVFFLAHQITEELKTNTFGSGGPWCVRFPLDDERERRRKGKGERLNK